VARRFFADHCISNQVVSALRAAEHEVLRLKDPMPQESPDLAVIAKGSGTRGHPAVAARRLCRHRCLPARAVRRRCSVADPRPS